MTRIENLVVKTNIEGKKISWIISTEERVERLKDLVIATRESGTPLCPQAKSLLLLGPSLTALRKHWFPPTLLEQRLCLALPLVL